MPETPLCLKENVKLCSFYISPLIGPVSIHWVHIIVDMIMKSTICDPAWSDGSVGNSSSEKLSRVTKVLNCWRQNLSFLRDLDADKGVCEVECKFLRDLHNLWIFSIWSNPISKNLSIFKTSPLSLWWGISQEVRSTPCCKISGRQESSWKIEIKQRLEKHVN